MRSSRELVLVSALLFAACGTEYTLPSSDSGSTGAGSDETVIPVEPDACEDSYLTYENFGEPFVLDWCRGCHSSSVPAGMRQKAPAAVNFDTLADVRTWTDRIAARAASVGPTMPPVGGPTDEERALLAEWLACGAR